MILPAFPTKGEQYIKGDKRRLVTGMQLVMRDIGKVWWRDPAKPNSRDRETSLRSWKEWLTKGDTVARIEKIVELP